MKYHKDVRYQCAAIVEPGEYTIDRWDGQQCSETNPHLLINCEVCRRDFCLTLHWHKHGHTELEISDADI